MITKVNEELAVAVNRTLHYYALFRYPISAAEAHRQCEFRCERVEIEDLLNELTRLGKVYYYQGYYALLPEIKTLLAERMAGNEAAIHETILAQKTGRFIYSFPFVRFVGISGSLSKGIVTHNSDFDFFIVTAKDRLWICRTLLHLFKKLTFLVGRQHHFCMNYFIDESEMALTETNIYTATELYSLIPVSGMDHYKILMEENRWLSRLLPNTEDYSRDQPFNDKTNGVIKKSLEWLIGHLSPAYWNKALMKLTDWKWKRKWAAVGYPQEDYDLAFKTTLHISKNHPYNYQKRILTELESILV